MWRAGISKQSGQWLAVSGQLISKNPGHRQYGFTLIELLIVLVILSISISFVAVKFSGKDAELKSASRRLLYTARRLSDDALFRKEKMILNLDLEKGEYQYGDKGRRLKLPYGVSIEKVIIGKEEFKKGPVLITFFPSGLRDDARIHISGKGMGNGYIVVIPALGERFEILEISGINSNE